MLGTTTDLIKRTLRDHGAAIEGVRFFDSDAADLLAYATLTSVRNPDGGDLQAVCGVYEWQQQPLAFLVDGQLVDDQNHLRRIRRMLAMRGGAPYIALIQGGALVVYSVGLDAATADAAQVKLPANLLPAQVVPHLSNERPGLTRRRWIEQVVLSLLDEAISFLIEMIQVPSEQAISLVGRALFTRFLADRGLMSDKDALLVAGTPVDRLFDTAESASRINAWLDSTFNGDLLPLSRDAMASFSPRVYGVVGDIMRRAPGGQLSLDWKEDWAHLDFAYIPVGVLSQAYEHFLRSHNSDTQEKEGGFYTPAPIAQMMLRGALGALRDQPNAHKAKVLDPAAGAGVFLISAFRHLVEEHWRATSRRPDTTELRRILYKQICGFDVNEEALRFAALGLYLVSIELDPNPRPVQKLKFEHNLRGHVLFKVGEHGSAGSLGANVGPEHSGRYDLVIGNPPWSSSTQLSEWGEIERRVRDVATPRLRHVPFRPLLPNEVLDLPFVWRAMDWCRPGGQIAFALHARMLFQQGDGMPEARNAILSALDVTGIVNGADLRNSRVWPGVSAAFCLLFARNAVPGPGASFRYVSPRREDRLNAAGSFRLDASSAPQLTPAMVIEQPVVLKVLYRGSQLDLELLNRMRSDGVSVDSYWRRFGERNGKAAWSGNGYQRIRESSRIHKDDGLPGEPAGDLIGKPCLVASGSLPILLHQSELPEFNQERVHHGRSRKLYRGPLLVVHQSPPAGKGRLNVAVCDSDLVYTESFYGYSAAEHPRGEDLVRFMALVIGSKPALWYSLLTSGKFGFEREVVEKSVIDAMCVPTFDLLSPEDQLEAQRLFAELTASDGPSVEATWREVDAWVARLYGLRARDTEVIADTLEFSAPFSTSREAAQQRPKSDSVAKFLKTLEGSLQPIAKRHGLKVKASEIKQPFQLPWLTLKLYTHTEHGIEPAVDLDVKPLLLMADALGTTEVMTQLDGGGLLVARLDQARYWTPTQARLFARRILWQHSEDLFKVRG